jgi:calnexin
MQNDILFDNIYIGHSEADAAALQAETFDVKVAVEKEEEEATKPKNDDKPEIKSPMDLNFMDDPVLYVKEKTQLFFEIAKRDPLEAVRFVPEVAGGLAVGALTLLVVLAGAIGGGAKAAPSKEQVKDKAQQAKEQAAKVKDQVAEAVASGTDTVKEEVNKRTTRSSAQ